LDVNNFFKPFLSSDPLQEQTLWIMMAIGCDKANYKDSYILMIIWNVCAIFAFELNQAICEDFINKTEKFVFWTYSKEDTPIKLVKIL
jgi:hypothetical protein